MESAGAAMMVRFTTTCDFKAHTGDEACGRRAGEYTSWPHCRECGMDLCPEHQVPGSLIDADVDQPATALCVDCVEGL